MVVVVYVSADSTNAAAAVAQAAIQKTQAVKHYHKQVSYMEPVLVASLTLSWYLLQAVGAAVKLLQKCFSL